MKWQASFRRAASANQPTTLVVIYSYGDFRAATQATRSDDKTAKPISITRDSCVPANKVVAFFSNPFANLDAARNAPSENRQRPDHARAQPAKRMAGGDLSFCFMAFFAVGPGVCVWLALSELMPTRIRSNGMSIALLINQAVSTTIAAVFLPTVGKYGYSTMFFAFAGCTVIYFITAAFFLPETKGKTLEEIEDHFEGRKRISNFMKAIHLSSPGRFVLSARQPRGPPSRRSFPRPQEMKVQEGAFTLRPGTEILA